MQNMKINYICTICNKYAIKYAAICRFPCYSCVLTTIWKIYKKYAKYAKYANPISICRICTPFFADVAAIHLESSEMFFPVYTRYIPGIYLTRGYTRNIPGIYPEYFPRIKACFHLFEYIYCFNEYVQCTERFCCQCWMKSPSFNVIWWSREQ